MKQLYFVLMDRAVHVCVNPEWQKKGYNLVGIFGDVEAAKKAKAEISEGNPSFNVKIYSGNFGIVEEEKGNE